MSSFADLELLSLLTKSSYFILFLPLIVGLIRFRKLDQIQVVIFFLCVLLIINDSFTLILKSRGEQNVWVYHFFVPLGFILMFKIYSLAIEEGRKVFKYISAVFLVFSLVNSAFFQEPPAFNSNAVIMASFAYILISIYFFFTIIKSQSEIRGDNSTMIWFNTGVLLSYSGTFVLFLFSEKILLLNVSSELLLAGWVLNTILYILFEIFCLISLCMSQKPSQMQSY